MIELGVPFFIFDIRASQASMKSRIVAREAADRDASDAGIHILEQQLRHDEPFAAEEAVHTIIVDMEGSMDRHRAEKVCAPILKVHQGDYPCLVPGRLPCSAQRLLIGG